MEKRLFAAFRIEPDDYFKRNFHTLQSKLFSDIINWVEPENIHVTLKFFGETPEEKIPAIRSALTAACQGFGPVDAIVARLGVFGSYHQPRVIWIGLEPGSAFKNLQQRIAKQIEPLGFLPDRQNFVPHLSLGRVKKIKDLHYFQQTLEEGRDAIKLKQRLTELYLYESVLQQTGAVYKVLSHFGLNP